MIINRLSVASGLSTDTFKVAVAGPHYIEARANEIPPSGIVITLSQTDSVSNSYSTPTNSPIEMSTSIGRWFNCAIGDILSCVVSSSNGNDVLNNKVKTTIVLRRGM